MSLDKPFGFERGWMREGVVAFERNLVEELAGLDTARQTIHPGGLVVRWVHRTALLAIAPSWGELSDRALSANVFLDPDFATPALQHIDLDDDLGAWTVWRSGRLVGLFVGKPAGFRTGRAAVIGLGWTHRFAPLGTPLIDRADPLPVVAAFLDHLIVSDRISALLLPFLDEDSEVSKLFDEVIRASGRRSARLKHHRRAALYPNGTDPVVGLKPKQAKNLRRLARRLAERGTLEKVSTAEGYPLESAINGFLTVEMRSWKGRAGTAMALSMQEEAFFRKSIRNLSAKGHARIDLLRLDDRPIAGTVVLSHGRHAFYFKTAYEESIAHLSPGVQITIQLTEALGMNTAIDRTDSCAIAHHPMIDRLWRGRMDVSNRMIATRPGSGGAGYIIAVTTEKTRDWLYVTAKRLVRLLQKWPI